MTVEIANPTAASSAAPSSTAIPAAAGTEAAVAPGATADARLGRRWPFVVVSAIVLLALAASSTPTPEYAVWQARWHFSPIAVTDVYAVYAIGVLVALLVVGGMSDVLGRRPVIIGALGGLAAAMVLFASARSLDWLYAARAVQGLATGVLLGATSAAMLDLHPRRDGAHAGYVNGIVNASGLGLGALVAGLLVQYAPGQRVVPFVLVGVLALAGIAAAVVLPEPVVRDPSVGLAEAVRPRVPHVPRALWRTFGLSSLGVLAAWSTGGLYLSLGPVLASSMLGSTNHAVGGSFVALVCVAGALAPVVFRTASTRTIVVGGSLLLALSSLLTAWGIHADSTATFLVGSALVGAGFGATFMGSLRALAAVIPPAHRAGVMSAFFVIAYASISIPAIAAGVAVQHAGLVDTATWFGIAVAAVALLVAAIGARELRPAPLPTT